ncbi:MAG: hypothetical protein WKG00_03700 [Polyangiaceae bacterium]
MLAAAGDRRESPALGQVLDRLDVARSALSMGAEAVAQIQLARRLELRGSGLRADGAPAARPVLASVGTPRLHAPARRLLVPEISLDPLTPPPEPQPRPKKLKRPKDLDALRALAAAAESGALAAQLEEPDVAPPVAEAVEAGFAYQPSIEEAEMLRRLGRDCLEDVANHRDLRKPNAMESWLDQAPFEQRLLDKAERHEGIEVSRCCRSCHSTTRRPRGPTRRAPSPPPWCSGASRGATRSTWPWPRSSRRRRRPGLAGWRASGWRRAQPSSRR